MRRFSGKVEKYTILGLALFVAPVGLYFGAEHVRNQYNRIVSNKVPAKDLNIITYTSGLSFGSMTSASHVLRTGQTGGYASFGFNQARVGNISIDWNRNDVFIKTYKSLEEQIIRQVESTEHLTKLRNKLIWSITDHQEWDRTVSEIIGELFDNAPGLNQYRSDENKKIPRTALLNNLSDDITHNTAKREFDCEGMSVIKACLLQATADRLLPFNAENRYYITGGVQMLGNSTSPAQHAFITCQASGIITGIVEAIENRHGLTHVGIIKRVTMDEARNGKGVLCAYGDIYAMVITKDEANALRASVDPALIAPPKKERSRIPAASP